ncbi:MAG: peptidoglycan DD-metalloendopeptidase family protein [Pseudomonadota bacterium]
MTFAGLLLVLALYGAQTPPASGEEADALDREAAEALAQSAARAAEADALADEIAALQQQLVSAAEQVRARELATDDAEDRLRELRLEEAVLQARLERERDSLNRVLAALQRVEAGAPPALAVSPDDAAQAARAAGLMAQIAPELQKRARSYADRLAELDALREALTGQGETVAEARASLERTREEVSALIEERSDAQRRLRREADDLSRRAADVAQQAQSLRDLLGDIRRFANAEPRLSPRRAEPNVAAPDRVERRPGAVPIPRLRPGREPLLASALPAEGPLETLRFADARGQLAAPAGGRVVAGAGERGPDGVAREGIWFETRPRAQVTAPFDGVVVYSGVFQTFDGVLMINTPDGYTLLLGGLALIYVSEGQSVLAGEPVAVMSDSEDPAPQLYLEIWRDADESVDPQRWLRPDSVRRR